MALFALRFLIGCQAEEKIGNEMHNHVQDGVEVSYLKGEEANIARQKLISKLQSENTIEILESTPIALRTNEGTIDFNTIVQVIDTLGIKNYTFRVINHPEDDYKTFHNLILTEKETTMEVKMFEYEMTDTFAQEYFAQLKSFQQFQGALRVSGVALISQPCDELEIEYPGDSSGGGGGGDSPGDSTPGDGSTSGSSVGGCVQTFLTIECSCGRSYNSWNAYEGSICGSGMYPGYSISVTVTFVYNTLCKNTQDPCNPDGTVGVLTPQGDCNTSAQAIKNAFPNMTYSNAQLLADKINQYGKSYGIDTNYKLRHFLSQIAHETNGLTNLNKEENANFSVQNMLTTFSKYFSLNDPDKENPNEYVGNPSKILSYVYCCRMGNGSPETQEGYKYRGRGIIMLTGKNNYTAFQNHYNATYNQNIDLIDNPDQVKTNTELAIISAMWFFQENVINQTSLINNQDVPVKIVTQKVNNGQNGITDRKNKHNICTQFIDCL